MIGVSTMFRIRFVVWIGVLTLQSNHYISGSPRMCADRYGKDSCPENMYYDIATGCCHNCWDVCSKSRKLPDVCRKKCPGYQKKLLEMTSSTLTPSVTTTHKLDNTKSQATDTLSQLQNSYLLVNNENWHIALEVTLAIALLVVFGLLLYSYKSYRTLKRKFEQSTIASPSETLLEKHHAVVSQVDGGCTQAQVSHSFSDTVNIDEEETLQKSILSDPA